MLLAPVEYRMYELLVIVIGHLCRKIVLLLLCSYAPLEDEKMYKRQRELKRELKRRAKGEPLSEPKH